MSQEWYYSIGGDRVGPVAAQELKKLVEAGTLKAADLVWKDGMADWVEARTIKGLFGGASSASTPAVNAAAPAKAADPKSAPARKVEAEDDEDDDRPRKRKAVAERDDADEDDEPRRRRDEDEEDDEPRPKKKKKKRRGVPDDVNGKKVTAGLLAILLGGWGIHKFYLGMTTPGVLQIVITLVTCGFGAIIPLIEGIIYLTKSDEDFYEMYVVDQKGWF